MEHHEEISLFANYLAFLRLTAEEQLYVAIVKCGPLVRKRQPPGAYQGEQNSQLHWIARKVTHMRLIEFLVKNSTGFIPLL